MSDVIGPFADDALPLLVCVFLALLGCAVFIWILIGRITSPLRSGQVCRMTGDVVHY